MADKIYISAADAHAGSSVIALGLVGMLSRIVDRIGFFKPVGDGAKDMDVAVVKSAYRLACDSSDMCPLSTVQARELMARGAENTMLDRICTAYDAIRGASDLVVLEGISHERSLNIFDLDINAAIASRLAAPVVLVAGASVEGKPVCPDALANSIIGTWRSFEEKGCELIGVVVNRVMGDQFETARERYIEALHKEDITVFGVLPDLPFLSMPRLEQIARDLRSQVLSGEEFLPNIATKIRVAAMEPRNFLGWLDVDNTLVITPGDRHDIMLAVTLAQMSPQHRRVSGLILTGGMKPDPAILKLVESQTGPKFPILAVRTDTYTTARAISKLDVRIQPGEDDKIYAAVAAVQHNVEESKLWDTLELVGTKPKGAGSFLETIITKAKKLDKAIVFPEGEEARTIRAVSRLAQGQVLRPILLGNPEKIQAFSKSENVPLNGVTIIDPSTSEKRQQYAEIVYEIRKDRRGGMTQEIAMQWVDNSPIQYGTVMVQCGEADGLVAGAIHATGDTIRPAFQIIGVRPEVGVASSVFFMVFKDRVLVYGDCAIIPSPNAQELAGIAVAAARTARSFGLDPRVAMLSYSTGTSGAGDDVDKVTEATALVHERDPGVVVDGPMQYDAAIDPDIGKRKQPDSPVAGQANVFIFPDLDAGNIAYKAVQRMSGALAVGPVMQGMNKPINDLSRGCSVDDIYYVGAITAIQADGL
ncbi:MAG: phosphate acetyltransferase [Phycisphaerae bacterium]|nr:phosphate acetyltransferase [Phycisphaerae bacterium]